MTERGIATDPPPASTARSAASIDATAIVHSKPVIRWPAASSRRAWSAAYGPAFWIW